VRSGVVREVEAWPLAEAAHQKLQTVADGVALRHDSRVTLAPALQGWQAQFAREAPDAQLRLVNREKDLPVRGAVLVQALLARTRQVMDVAHGKIRVEFLHPDWMDRVVHVGREAPWRAPLLEHDRLSHLVQPVVHVPRFELLWAERHRPKGRLWRYVY
jgi:hypothetical protein